MSKEETFYKLKYSTFPTLAQVEELKNTDFGSFVLFELASAVLGETDTTGRDALLRRVERNPFGEMGEFFHDLSQSQPTDMEQFKKATLNEFINLMALADEMENG